MGFTVQHQCPQCGAPVELKESSRLLRCPYCNVASYLFTPDYFRFVIPCQRSDKNIIFVPYMRFKGVVYSLCSNTSIDHRIVDITRSGTSFKGLPISLGLRPQAMKMKFVTPGLAGSFLSCSLSSRNILNLVQRHYATSTPKESLHTAYIGEALSIIYLPVYLENNKIFDAVTDMFLLDLPGGRETLETAMENNPEWQLTFMATLCPNCGWDLRGEEKSVALTCSNCNKIWVALNGKFTEVAFRTVPGEGDNTVYLPFWRINAETHGSIQINSYADFIRISNQPRVVKKNWENQDIHFWIPAFKIRPKFFLTLSTQMTLSEKKFKSVKKIPEDGLYPVTLPHTEAIQSLKIILANSIMPKNKMFPLFPELNFKIKGLTLVYIPFDNTGYDMIRKDMHIAIPKKALESGLSSM